MLRSLAPARRRLVLGVVLVLVLGLVTAVTARLVTHRDSAAAPVAQDLPGPVLLVPGYGGSTTGLSALAERLRAAGRTAVVVPLPDGGTGDLRTQATILGAAVRAELVRTGARSVDVVGYSAGGVVARLWARDDGGARLARRILTLGSPQHGTQVAGLASALVPSACPTACRQLAPDSDLLDRLNDGDETPAGPTWVSLWTTHDEVVDPPDSARLAGALDLTVQGVCTSSTVQHGALPTDRVVQGIVLAELSGDAPVRLSTRDCARVSS